MRSPTEMGENKRATNWELIQNKYSRIWSRGNDKRSNTSTLIAIRQIEEEYQKEKQSIKEAQIGVNKQLVSC